MMKLRLEDPVTVIPGIGPFYQKALHKKAIRTVKDLLLWLPLRWQAQSLVEPPLVEHVGAWICCKGLIVENPQWALGRGAVKCLAKVCVSGFQGSEHLFLKWFFAPPFLRSQLKKGETLLLAGVLKKSKAILEIIHPKFLKPEHLKGPIPIYSKINGIQTGRLRQLIETALSQGVLDLLPQDLLEKNNLPSLSKAFELVHTQPDHPLGMKRLKYQEAFEWSLTTQSFQSSKKVQAHPWSPGQWEAHIQKLQKTVASLPFELTNGQKKILSDLVKSFREPTPLNGLLQGDVGSGKTILALLCADFWLEAGFQVSLAAPTEILAQQHYLNALKIFGNGPNIRLLTGSTSKKARESILGDLQKGLPMLLIGTHALFEPDVVFQSMHLMMMDEQHRFGVEQRKRLKEKGTFPHTLLLSATPIPRTLALSCFGHMKVFTLKELPHGRKAIQTRLVRSEIQRLKVFNFFKQELQAHRQGYVIVPLVEESEDQDLKSAIEQVEILRQEVFQGFKVGLLHGKMPSDQKQEVMEAFKNNQIQVLVATTVVEVGVDVPNATVMVIEHAERFGLSQLHQLRGRVGRGSHESWCFLMSEKKSKRLEVLTQTQDGFLIAEADLELRGSGELMGTLQSGISPFHLIDFQKDEAILESASQDVGDFLRKDPKPAFLEVFQEIGKLQNFSIF